MKNETENKEKKDLEKNTSLEAAIQTYQYMEYFERLGWVEEKIDEILSATFELRMKKRGETFLGCIYASSGNLMIVDAVNIDKEWEEEEYDTLETIIHPDGSEEKVVRASERWFELIDDINKNKIKLVEGEKIPQHHFSYNAVCQKIMSEKGYGQIRNWRNELDLAVAFSPPSIKGIFPVYGRIEKDEFGKKKLMEVRIDLSERMS